MQKYSLLKTLNPMKNGRRFASLNKEAVFATKPYKLHKLDQTPHSEVKLTRDECLDMYRQMNYIRRMETTLSNLYKEKQIRGFCHLYSGQEAIAVGMRKVIRDSDSVITGYRCHGWAYVMGVPISQVISELCGKVTGNVHGKGGSMHLYTKNFFGGNGIVGAQAPVGTGVAFAYKYKGQDNVCYTLYGDGAANQGQVFESFNMAKLWKLPVVFVVENNGFGMGTSAERSSASTDYYSRGDYVPGLWVDAMDMPSVIEATRFASHMCRNGEGPVILEMATYRYHGHSMSDPGTSYRTREEIQEVRKRRDPITGFKDKLLTANLATEQELKEIETSVKKEVDAVAEQSVKQSEGPVDLLYTDVYLNTPNLTIRGTTPFNYIRPQYQTSGELLEAMGK